MDWMKPATILYLVLASLGLLVIIGIPLVAYKTDGAGFAMWSSVVHPGPLSAAHAFLEGKCESCHVPNKGIAASKCIACHAFAPELLLKPATAFHSRLGDCRGCHIEHQGIDMRPISMDHQKLFAVAKQTTGHPGALDCQACHLTEDKHQGFFGRECASCHVTTTWKIGGFLHPSPKSINCAQCHKPPPSHYMMHFEMMDRVIANQKGARVEQCFACHQTDSFNNIKGRGIIKMH